MGITKTYHRPLVSGIAVLSGKTVENRIEIIGTGTLTGLATRNSDDAKVLVTNLHVMAGVDADDNYRNPTGSEGMYQLTHTEDKKVGTIPAWDEDNPAWVPLGTGNNIADVAYCELADTVTAEFILHDYPNHSNRRIIAGVVEPVDDDENPMELTMMGASRGEGTVTVEEVNRKVQIAGRSFTGLTLLDCSQRPVLPGDSGAACVSKVRDGQYRMSCIVFARVDAAGLEAWAFPASVAERELGITFGDRTPTANAGPDHVPIRPPARELYWMVRGAVDPQGDTLTYQWAYQSGTRVGITDATEARASFTERSTLFTTTFRLTVTNPAGLSDTADVTITGAPFRLAYTYPNPDSSTHAGNSAYSQPVASGTFGTRSNKIQVKVTSMPTVNPAVSQVRAYLEAGQPPNLTTVTEAIGTSLNSWVTVLSSSDTQWQTGNWAAHIRFENSVGNSSYSTGKSATVPTPPPPPRPRPTPTPETWGPWTDTGVREEDDTDVPRIIWKQQQRTSDRGNTETRWVRA